MVAIIRSPNAGRQDALGRVAYPPIRLSRYVFAAQSGSASTNTTNLRAAVDKAIAKRTWVINDLPNGTYPLVSSGDSPYLAAHDHCIDLGDGTENFRLYGNANAIFIVGTGQIAGSTRHCMMFVGRDLKDCEFRGTYDGGSLQQAGWTGGYEQNYSGAFFFYGTSAGGGCRNLTFRDLTVRNTFGNPVNSYTTDGRNVHGDVSFINCRASRFGEGFQFADGDTFFMDRCYIDDTANTSRGDFIEPARFNFFHVKRTTIRAAAHSSVVGSHVDCFGSVAGLVERCTFIGGNDGIGTQSDSGTVTSVDVVGTTFTNMRSVTGSCADKGHVRLKNCDIRGCGTASVPPVQVGSTNAGGASDIGAVVEIDGGTIDASYPIFVTRNGTLVVKNRTVVSNSLGEAAILISRADSSTPVVDLDVVVRSPAGFGVLVHGQGSAFSPKGRIRGVFSGAVNRRNFSHSSGGTYDQLEVDVTMPEAVQSYLNYFELVGAKESNDPDYDPGVHPGGADIRAGSKGQRVMFRGVSASRTFTNAAAWQLTTSTFTLDTKSSILMEHIGGGVWREVQRWVMA